MKIPVIKKLVEDHDIEVLDKAEMALLNEEMPEIEIGGDDEGEQLTHVMGAKWIKEHMQAQGVEFKKALRAYTLKVRKSIS